MENRICIDKMRRVAGGRNLKALCDIRIATPGGNWVIRGFRIVQQPNQRAWFSLPTVSWKDETGNICYKTMLELPPRIKSEIGKIALEVFYETQAIAA